MYIALKLFCLPDMTTATSSTGATATATTIVGMGLGFGIVIASLIHHFKRHYKLQTPVLKKTEEEKRPGLDIPPRREKVGDELTRI